MMAGEIGIGNRELHDLLDYLKRSRGFDFSGYKRATLSRRIEKRMAAVEVATFSEYQDFLEVNPREFTELFNTILINVTSFFRDQPAWDFLSADVVPQLLESLAPGQPLRIWSAGCASGEEAYTVAMVLAEAMGEDVFKSRVKIYATDLDDDALATARHGAYSNDALKPVPPELIDKYFEPNTRGLAFRPDLRRSVIFGRNDLIADAPISRIDLLLCRNVLMYFTPEAQGHILDRFNFALNPTGFLFLGKSEMLLAHDGELFAPYDLKSRFFRKVQRDTLRDRLGFVIPELPEPSDRGGGMRAMASALAPVAQIVIDRRGFLVDANRRARDVFGVAQSDLGRPFQDAAVSYRPADLRSAIDRAYQHRLPVRLEGVPWNDHDGSRRVLDIEVVPVMAADGETLGASISLNDVTAFARLTEEYERSKRELETAYEELQSTVEELETTNEELQSTNEELETMNEELQSTNDELETMNSEANTRATELDRLNLFFEGILGSLRVGVIVIDSARTIQVWNAMSDELWGLRADEVGGHDLMELDIGLPVKQLDDAIARAFGAAAPAAEERVEAINRRGQRFTCVVRVMPLRTRAGDAYAAMILTTPATSA